MDIKLVAFDMDGTLLNSRHELSPETIRALYKLKEKGIICVICTGRSLPGLSMFGKLLRLNMPMILYNGSLVLNQDKNILKEYNVPQEEAIKIWNFAKDHNANITLWSNNKIYCNRINNHTLNYSEKFCLPIEKIDNFINFVQNHKISKMCFNDTPENIINLKLQVKKIKNLDVNYCISNPFMLEFFNKEASKANALKCLGEYYNIKPNQMMAFGDGENDIDMLDYVGFGVVMDNALSDVKKHGRYITKSNNEDGVAYAIKKLLFN